MFKLQWPEDYTEGQVRRSGPWPGPVPYREGDPHYRGRSLELSRLLRIIDREPLLLLTGPSGTGKTSFLRAALIPKLRVERAEAVLKDGDKTARPAVLVVRDWLTAQRREQRDYDGIIKNAVTRSVEALHSDILPAYRGDQHSTTREIIERDYKDLSRAQRSSAAYQYIADLAAAAGSLLLCMDQFEEVLQGSSEQRVVILDTIAQLVKQRSFDIKVLLSFRQEFSTLFQRLDRQVGNLTQATVYLEEMPESEVRGVLLESAESGGVKITERALDRLLDWMQGSRRKDGSVRLGGSLSSQIAPTGAEGSRSVDLLRLQALLQGLYRLAAGENESGDLVTISDTTLDRLLQQEKSENEDLTGPGLVELALRLFIDRQVLPLPIVEPTDSAQQPARLSAATGLPRKLEVRDEEAMLQRLQERRVTARMAEFFSSLGLKVQQHEAHLTGSALREEWGVLGSSAESIEGLVASVGLKAAPTRVAQLGLSHAEIDQGEGILSGRAITTKRWTRSDAVKQLLEISCATLDRLDKFGILRPKMTRQGTVYELVHDGFGPALSDWAEGVRGDPLDVLGAITAQRGVSFGWRQLGGRVEQVCWRGSVVGPALGHGELLLDNVEWIDCDLRGTLFVRCCFKGGSFENCDLHGVIFRDCAFSGASKDEGRFTFNNVRANGLTFWGGSLANLDFVACSLDKMLWDNTEDQQLQVSDVAFRQCQRLYQWSVEGAGLVRLGPLKLEKCELLLCDLRSLSSEVDQARTAVEIHGCRFNYCLLHGTLAKLIDQSRDNQRYPKLDDALL